ncbi:hypothetical protein IWW57_003851 [Coemansia sp. S610]|nr:hypothetical protein IWW57_003851 [Coemansia sp. S610]KAJ2412285.1 hypothetical protein GGI10_003772 [Coemansia sp. RSA 2530]KAJ2703008.1 hypothetical protein H4218_000506 [Coemansia sp. IMI 209128]
MSTESHFQRLPLHVAHLVVNHVVHGGSSDLFGGPKPSLKPLLWACRNFRAIVFAQVSGSFKLWLDRHRDQLKSEWRFTSLFYVQTGIPKYRFAKELCLWLDEQSVYSGKMLDMLLRESYDVGTFPMARSMLLCFMPLPLPEDGIEVESIDIDSDEAEANLNAFVQHIKLMAPNVSNIKVWGSDNRRYQPFASSSRFQTLSARLYMLTNSIGFVSTSENLKIDLPLSLIHDVAHINYSSSECNGQVFSLIRHCAPTLESLTLSARCFDDRLASLIRCDNGTHTTYPRLLTLSISSYSNADSSSEPTFENAVPFPSLQHLHINKYYSFGDDVLFRGNSATLRSLHLVLNPFAVDLLTRHKVFTSTSHPNLQIVKIKRISGLIAISFRASAHNYMRFALMIGPNAVVRDIGSRKTADDFRGIQPDTHLLRPALSLFTEHPWISVLALSDMRLELWDGLDVVKSLPQLTDLHTDGITFDEMPHGVTADELPDYVVATYGSASERFRCWHIIDYRTGGCDVLASCVLLLALACPSFSYIAHPYSSRIQVYEPMVNMSKSARFEPYMPRLERLFSKWKD